MSHKHIRTLALVEDEYEAARFSVDYAKENWATLYSLEAFASVSLGKLGRSAAGIETTYLVRLFSVFEAILRDYIPHRRGAAPDRRSAYDLISKAASSLHIPTPIRDGVQQVRDFRNQTVHNSNSKFNALTFDEARSSLNKFLAWLP